MKYALLFLTLLLAVLAISSPVKDQIAGKLSLDQKLYSGQVKTFRVDNKKLKDRNIQATLISQSPIANFWIDKQHPISKDNVGVLNKTFMTKVYPNNMKYFASRQTSTNMNKVNVLITDLENTDGYFSAGDLGSGHQSNLIFMNTSVVADEPSEASATLAHEFAHLLYYLNGAPQNELLDEVLAVYAESINGKYPYYAQGTDYGQTFLFLEKATKAVASSGGSVQGFTRSLASGSSTTGIKTTFKKYISNPDLDALGEIVDGNAQREVSLTSAFLRFAR